MSETVITTSRWREIIESGLWKNNPGIVQLLGLCPVLAISNSVINALALGIATALVTMLSSGAVASIRHFVPNEIRNPIFILIIASLVTCVDLLMNAYLYDLYKVLGIFIPLITTNCIVLARAESYASKNPVRESMLDGLSMGLGLTCVLLVLGAARELVGHGTLFAGAEMIFGEVGRVLTLQVIPEKWNYNFLLASLPPGAFFALGSLIALKNFLQSRRTRRGKSITFAAEKSHCSV